MGGVSLQLGWEGNSLDSRGAGDDSQVFHCVARTVQRCVVRGAWCVVRLEGMEGFVLDSRLRSRWCRACGKCASSQ